MKTIIIFIFLSLIFVGLIYSQESFIDDYHIFDGQEYVFKKATYEDIINILTYDEDVNVILFAYDPDFYECPYCMTVIPIINEIALEENIDKITYLDIFQMRKNNNLEYQNLLNYLDIQVDDLIIRDGVKKIIVPDLYVVKNGEVLSHHIATIKDEDGAYIKDLNDLQKEELKSIYRNMFRNTQ